MKTIKNIKFENINWHDSEIVSIIFDPTNFNRVKIIFDVVVVESHSISTDNNTENYIMHRQLMLATFYSVGNAKIDLRGQDNVAFFPRVAFIDTKESNVNSSTNDVCLFDYIIQMSPEGVMDSKTSQNIQLYLSEVYCLMKVKIYII